MNGTLTSTAVTSGKEVKMLIQNYANLTLTDMNLVDNTGYIQYALSNNSGETYVNGETYITVGDSSVAFDVYDYTYGGYDETPVVYVNTTGVIKGKIEVWKGKSKNPCYHAKEDASSWEGHDEADVLEHSHDKEHYAIAMSCE